MDVMDVRWTLKHRCVTAGFRFRAIALDQKNLGKVKLPLFQDITFRPRSDGTVLSERRLNI